MKRALVLITLVVVAALSGLPAQEALSLDTIVEQAIRNNLDLGAAYDSLREAEENLGWQSELLSSRVSVNGGYDYSPDAPDPHSLSGQVSLTVPITPQVSVSGSFNSQERGNVSVSLSPFAFGGGDYRDQQTYARALAQAEYQRVTLPFNVENAVFGVLESRMSLSIAQAKLELEQQSYGISEQLYELGELSYEELEQERSTLLSTRQSGFDAERGLLNAEIQLYRLLGPTNGEIVRGGIRVAQITVEQLEALLIERKAALAQRKQGGAGSMNLTTLLIDLEALQRELKATWAYRPNLSLSASVSYPFSASGSISLSFSPNDLKGEEREDLLGDIQETQHRIEIERLNVGYQEKMLERALEISTQVLEVRKTEVEQAQTALAEAQLLYEQGERTDIELGQTRLALDTARMRLFSAFTDCIDATSDLVLIYQF